MAILEAIVTPSGDSNSNTFIFSSLYMKIL